MTITLPEFETVDYPRKREEKTQNTDSHNTFKLELPTQLERTITTSQENEGLNTKHHKSLRKIKQWIRKFDLIEAKIQYAIASTSVNIFGIYIISAFPIQFILCLKVQVEINFPCLVHTAVPPKQ